MRRLATALTWLVLCIGVGLLSPVCAEDELSTRSFEVHYRSLGDTADLVSDVLSPQGILTLNPRLKVLIVQDRPAVLRQIESLIESFDLPPRRTEVVVHLFLGHRESSRPQVRTAGSEFSKEVRGVVETLGDFTKWTSYESLGSQSITAVEGEPVKLRISDLYRVDFTVEAVHPSQSVVKFERFSLQRVTLQEDGSEASEELYTAGMAVDAGKLTLVIAASAPDSQRALFLALQVTAR
jgi:hypothetical protein